MTAARASASGLISEAWAGVGLCISWPAFRKSGSAEAVSFAASPLGGSANYNSRIRTRKSGDPPPFRASTVCREFETMPIYEYQCRECSHRLEKIQKMSDSPLTRCPECGKDALTKLVSAAGFRLKGGGWYETDFKKDGKRNLAGDDSGKSDKKSSSGSDAKSDSKSKSGDSGGSSSAGSSAGKSSSQSSSQSSGKSSDSSAKSGTSSSSSAKSGTA